MVPPEEGRLAGGDSGPGGWPSRRSIVAGSVSSSVRPGGRPRAATSPGVRVVVSAGGTREAIDPVRFITNRSSGKQGHALAEAAAAAGPTWC